MGYPSLSVAQSVYNPGRLTNDTAPRIEQTVFDVGHAEVGGDHDLDAIVNGVVIDDDPLNTGDTVALLNDGGVTSGIYIVGAPASVGTLYKSTQILYQEGYRIIRVARGTVNGDKLFQIQDDYTVEEVGTIPADPLTNIGRIHFAIVCNLGNDDLWIQFFDTASTPEDGDVPHISVLAQPNSYATLDFGAAGRPLQSGSFYICASTSARTLTLDDTDSCQFDITYSK